MYPRYNMDIAQIDLAAEGWVGEWALPGRSRQLHRIKIVISSLTTCWAYCVHTLHAAHTVYCIHCTCFMQCLCCTHCILYTVYMRPCNIQFTCVCNFQPIIASFSGFLPFSAMLSHLQQFQAIFSNCQPFSGLSRHFQPFPAISRNFQLCPFSLF